MIRWLTTGLVAASLAACQPGDKPGSEYMPDMARGPAYKAFAPNRATRNGITLQRPVPGTIARGYHPFHYGRGDAEGERAGRELTNPFHPDPVTLEKGKFLFLTYCAVCHGEQGKGDGAIAAKIPPPPSYKSDRLMTFPPGRFFQIVTMGSNKMPSYAAQLSPEDRWLIITFIRAVIQELPESTAGAVPIPAAPVAPAASAAETAAAPGQPVPATPSTPPAPAVGSGGSQ